MPPHPEKITFLRSDADFESDVLRRIDSLHQVHTFSQSYAGQQPRPGQSTPLQTATWATSSVGGGAGSFDPGAFPVRQDSVEIAPPAIMPEIGLDPQSVVLAHAEDLLDKLQRLSEDLDIRSAKLNADIALQERRERAFRLWAQQRTEEIRAQRDDCDRQRQQLKTQARRIAVVESQHRSPQW